MPSQSWSESVLFGGAALMLEGLAWGINLHIFFSENFTIGHWMPSDLLAAAF